MPTGAIDENFMTQVSFLTTWANTEAAGLANTGTTTWATPLDGITPVDNLDIPDQAVPFARTNINEMYEETITTDDGSLGDAMSLRLQGDYLSTMERAYRLRTSTSIRRKAWTAARLTGHGNGDLGIFMRVLVRAQDLLEAGSAGFLKPAFTPLPAFPDLVAQATSENKNKKQATTGTL